MERQSGNGRLNPSRLTRMERSVEEAWEGERDGLGREERRGEGERGK